MILDFLSDAGRLSRLCNNTRPVSSVKWKLTEISQQNKNGNFIAKTVQN
jgi:hypothetical protein